MNLSVLLEDQPFWREAEECLVKFEFQRAIEIYQAALQIHPNNTTIIDALGTAFLQAGEFQRAEQMFKISIQLAPNVGHEKYMSLAGMLSGQQAIALYQKGIEILLSQRQSIQDPTLQKEAISQLISGFCAIAEIYLTDECYNPNAELVCEKVLTEALNTDPQSTEALQTMASFKISQQKTEEALKFLQASYSTWGNLDPEHANYPQFEFRTQSAKLFLELNQNNLAVEILDDLIEEDDEIAELWFLEGFALVNIDSTQSLECLLKSRELLQQTGCQDPIIINRVEESIANVKKILEEDNQANPQMDTEMSTEPNEFSIYR